MLRNKLLSFLRIFRLSILPKDYLQHYNMLNASNKTGLSIPATRYVLVNLVLEQEIQKEISEKFIRENLPDKSELPNTVLLNWKPERDRTQIVESAIDYRAYISSNQYLSWFGSKLMALLTVNNGRSFWRIETMRQLRKANPDIFKGRVLEIGAGTALISCQLSLFLETREIYALDYDEYTVTNLMPLVQWALDADVAKIRRVVGSYNEMNIDTDSFDAIIAVGSMHHSENLEATMRECFRVLKPGGKFIISDYGLTSGLTQQEYSAWINLPKAEKDAALLEKGASSVGMRTNKTISEHARPVYIYQAAAFKAGFNLTTTYFDATKDNGGSISRLWRRARESFKPAPFYKSKDKSRTHGYDKYGNVRAFSLVPEIRYPAYAKRAPSLFNLMIAGDHAGMPVYDNIVMVLEKPVKQTSPIAFKYPTGNVYHLPVELEKQI